MQEFFNRFLPNRYLLPRGINLLTMHLIDHSFHPFICTFILKKTLGICLHRDFISITRNYDLAGIMHSEGVVTQNRFLKIFFNKSNRKFTMSLVTVPVGEQGGCATL